jgi:hypothetical protein
MKLDLNLDFLSDLTFVCGWQHCTTTMPTRVYLIMTGIYLTWIGKSKQEMNQLNCRHWQCLHQTAQYILPTYAQAVLVPVNLNICARCPASLLASVGGHRPP